MDDRLVEEVLDEERSESLSRSRSTLIRDLIEADSTSTYPGLAVGITFYVLVLYMTAVYLLGDRYLQSWFLSSTIGTVVTISMLAGIVGLLYQSRHARHWHKLLTATGYGIFGVGMVSLVDLREFDNLAFQGFIEGVWWLWVLFCFLKSIGLVYGHYRSGPPTLASLRDG